MLFLTLSLFLFVAPYTNNLSLSPKILSHTLLCYIPSLSVIHSLYILYYLYFTLLRIRSDFKKQVHSFWSFLVCVSLSLSFCLSPSLSNFLCVCLSLFSFSFSLPLSLLPLLVKKFNIVGYDLIPQNIEFSLKNFTAGNTQCPRMMHLLYDLHYLS